MRKKLNIIGAGYVAKTLGALRLRAGVLQIGDVLNTSHVSAREAVAFMQAGRALVHIGEMQPADLYLLDCADAHIQSCCESLAQIRDLFARE